MKLIFMFFIALALAAPVFGADERPADLADSWIVVVKDGHDEEFEKAFTDHLKHRARKKDPRVWKTYAPIVGDDLNFYVVRFCCTTYAGMDDYRAWSQKNKMNDHWNENVDPHVADYKHYFARIDFKNGNWPEDDSEYKLFGVTSFDSKNGRAAAIEKSKTELSEAAKSGGWSRHWSWSNSVGGDGGLNLVTPFKDYAGLQGPEGGFSGFLAKHVGEAKAGEMLSGFSENFHGSTYTIYRLIDEMSMSE
ncbi:MAG: hypothetical protein OER80_03775 [Gammaproteobacteria bacterium]|nr:hypothetical protein [Gammaproteobacteria bacterium]